MEANKILSASLIDLLFDGRNKNYGAYKLRKTNLKRTRIALSITISVVALIFSFVSLGNAGKPTGPQYRISEGIELAQVDEPLPEDLPEPEPIEQPEPEPVETIQFTPPEIVPDEEADNLVPDIDAMDSAQVDIKTQEGRPDIFVEPPKLPGEQEGIIQPKKMEEEDQIRTSVDVPARFKDNWSRFLLKHLDPETPVKNDAPTGRYSVVIQFVVDKEGNVSEIRPLTSHGHGMEEEAVRVLKRSPQWEPAFLNGYKVKAYHRQVITFEVNPEE
jgi:protein TonB